MISDLVMSALGIVLLTGAFRRPKHLPAPAGVAAASAQAAPPAPMKNLQVLPKDMPQPQVVAIMRGSTRRWVWSAATAISGRSPAIRATTWQPTRRSRKRSRAP